MAAFAGYPLLVDERVVGVLAMFARHPLSDAFLSDLAPLPIRSPSTSRRKRVGGYPAGERVAGASSGRAGGERHHLGLGPGDESGDVERGRPARFGYTPEQVGPDASWWFEPIHPDDRDRIVHGIHAAIDGGEELWQVGTATGVPTALMRRSSTGAGSFGRAADPSAWSAPCST